jgi:hypothetical protein
MSPYPDPEQQMPDINDVELVVRHRHRRPNRTTSRSSDYQVVAGEASSVEGDEYVSGEDEGLISNLSMQDQTSTGGTLDDYFYYGFNNAEAAIDWRCAFWLVVSFLLITALAVVLPGFNNFGKPIVEPDGTVVFPNGTKTVTSRNNNNNKTSHRVDFACPAHESVHEAENYHNTSVEESYLNRTSQIESNFTGFLLNFHQSEFDGWGKTYDFVKSGMYHWKSTRFPKNLKDGDTIYESACGIGLNL